MKKGSAKPSSEEARKILIKEQQEKQAQCSKEVQAVLDKYGMQLQAVAQVQANQVSIIPKG